MKQTNTRKHKTITLFLTNFEDYISNSTTTETQNNGTNGISKSGHEQALVFLGNNRVGV